MVEENTHTHTHTHARAHTHIHTHTRTHARTHTPDINLSFISFLRSSGKSLKHL